MIQNLIEFSLKKPLLNHFILLFIFLLSIFAYFKIPKEIFPPSTTDAVIINGAYTGASSELLDKIAVSQIEDEILTLSSADTISSTIKNGSFSINVDLKDGYKAKDILDDVKDIITKIKTDLPSDMDEPTVKAVEFAFPLITVAVYSKNGDSKEYLIEVAKDIKSKVMQLKDLSQVQVLGESDKELLITLNDEKISAYGFEKIKVINAISSLSSIFPIGMIKDSSTHYYLSTFNGEKDVEKIKEIILKIDGKSVRLKDIAKIDYQLGDVSSISHFNANTNIAVGINKGFSGDAIELVKKIKDITKEFEAKYENLEFDTYIDTSIWIKNRLNTVVSNILFGLILLFLALLFFINLRIAIVIAIGIPTSFMIGLISAEYLGYSLNMLSLLGALIALGMLVDEAIVVAENIYRHMEMGKDKFSAARDGALEMFPAVLTATATTIFAFLPILLMSGEVGKFMQILPIMITILLLSSLIEAFFFLPLHAKEIFKVNKAEKKSHKIWDFNYKLYGNILEFLLKGKYIAIFGMLILIVVSSFLIMKNQKFKFMPEFDSTQIYITGSIGVGKKIEQTEEMVFEIEKKLLNSLDFKNSISSVSSVTGMKLDGKNLPHYEEFYFHIFVNLHERAAENLFEKYINPYLSPKYDDSNMIRDLSAQDIEHELKKILDEEVKSNKFEELKIFVPQTGIVKNDVEIAVSGKKEETLAAVEKLKNILVNVQGVTNIADDSILGNYELKFKINSYGHSLGVTEELVLNQLRPFYFKGTYSKMFDKEGLIDIVFESEHKDILESLDNFTINISNQKVLLKDVAEFIKIPAYSQIFKENNEQIISVTASLSNITSSELFEKIEVELNELKKDVKLVIKGEQEENEKVKKEMAQAALIAIILIFMALIWMFDSIVKPLIILSTIPLSILGVLVGHVIMGMNISMPSLIGMVGLAGVIVNDGIIMMDFIKKSKDLEDLVKYAKMRLRPILLTSITTILGLSTLIFFSSGQALILQPMAVSLGFGLLWATILNLYFVPMIYRIVYLRKM
ncbi:efflux RND transporter permease subunit [Arcobacter aquimarinus]|uniref:RND family efflux system, inner membrane transporter, AcrB family n=1 Tax=Arcobacter aquimarinus TaxID=1315211 RepID=A0AAE7E0U0_9BACT|nr:efflux RND transporter permease subunit [Arcobacter aquimarinus]MCB9097283.1 efflux RND transporter permease subunit [Arcobacter sp.]QKE25930.1 RND family efflux system, inner membrane transporter, AcrB family [Arcobacter aquimarinus]RXI35569.1 acriflavin resistance protein [Arcobacter aquimarinus]